MIKFIYKTYHPKNASHLFGEQYFLHSLLKDKVEFVDSLDGLDGAIISIRGCDNLAYIPKLNEEISRLKWCLIIVTGNENSTDFYRAIKHPNCRIWVQTPKHMDEANGFIGFGYPAEIPQIETVKDLDWFFAGQVNNPRRKQCVEVLRKMHGGELVETAGFNQGLPYDQYLEKMRRAKVIPCAGAPVTPDTFRVYEALECGCIPVVDAMMGKGSWGGDYWGLVWHDLPLITIQDWRLFPNVLQEILANYDEKSALLSYAWKRSKERIVENLFYQVESISK